LEGLLQVDHHTPQFAELLVMFKEKYPEMENPTEFEDVEDSFDRKFLPADAQFSRRWKRFHKKLATLRMTHKNCNNRRPRYFSNSPVVMKGEPEPKRVYLKVPYATKDHAKTLGARFDGNVKCWYAGPQSGNALLEEYDILPFV
jgi:hypothetical protein